MATASTNTIEQLFKNLGNRFASLGLVQQLLAGTLALGLVGGAGFLVMQSSQQYAVMYSNMSLTDAAATVAKLQELGKPYRLTDGGTTILVPANDKNSLLLETATELTSNEPVSLTKIPPVLQGDVQKEWVRRFNSDTIGKTLEAINGVRKAEVIIAQPEQSVFSSNTQPTQASVMLVVEPGFKLKESQIKTIKHLVSHAVPGLTAEMVAISDNYGNSLDESGLGGATGGVQEEAEARRSKTEKELQQKLLHLLEPIVGQDNAVISVSAELNLDESRAKIHTVTPTNNDGKDAKGVIVSKQEQSEEYTGSKPPEAGGAAGTNTNASPSYQADKADDKNGGKNYVSTKSTTNYAHSEEDKEVIYASGTVKRLSVAVALNKALLPSEIEELKTMIISAAGLNLQRGDTIDLRGFQFSESPNKQGKDLNKALNEGQQQDFILKIAYLVVLVGLGLTALIVFYNLLKKPAQAEWVGEEEDEEDNNTYANASLLPGLTDEHSTAVLQAAIATGNPQVIAATTAALKAQGQNPEMAIRLLGQTPLGHTSSAALPILESPLSPEVESIRAALHATIEHDPGDAARLLVGFMRDESNF